MKLLAAVVANVMLLVLTTTLLCVLRCDAAEESDVRFHWDADGRPVVRTHKGTLKGVREKSVSGHPFLSFYAIPYAKPPLDELRFQVRTMMPRVFTVYGQPLLSYAIQYAKPPVDKLRFQVRRMLPRASSPALHRFAS